MGVCRRSLIVVLTALPARLLSIPFGDLAPHWDVVLNLLAGSLIGAWLGATWATRMRSAILYKVLAGLLVLIAAILVLTHVAQVGTIGLPLVWQIITGVIAGALIGIIAAIMGVAGGELLIPTMVLLYGLDIKVAGSLSLAVSLPTMPAGECAVAAQRSVRSDTERDPSPPGAGVDRRAGLLSLAWMTKRATYWSIRTPRWGRAPTCG